VRRNRSSRKGAKTQREEAAFHHRGRRGHREKQQRLGYKKRGQQTTTSEPAPAGDRMVAHGVSRGEERPQRQPSPGGATESQPTASAVGKTVPLTQHSPSGATEVWKPRVVRHPRRRTVKNAENSADFDATYRYYYDGGKLVDVRNRPGRTGANGCLHNTRARSLKPIGKDHLTPTVMRVLL